MATTSTPSHLPTIDPHLRGEAGRELQATLLDLVDLALTGKQLHWSVVGTNFRALHVYLDELVEKWHEPRRCRCRARRRDRHVPRRAGRRRGRAQHRPPSRAGRDRGSGRRAGARAPHRRGQRARARSHGSHGRARRRLAGRADRGRAGARGAAVDGARAAPAWRRLRRGSAAARASLPAWIPNMHASCSRGSASASNRRSPSSHRRSSTSRGTPTPRRSTRTSSTRRRRPTSLRSSKPSSGPRHGLPRAPTDCRSRAASPFPMRGSRCSPRLSARWTEEERRGRR